MTKRRIIPAILIIAFLLHPAGLLKSLQKVLSFFIPFYIGFAFAYLLNPILHFLELRLLSRMQKSQHRRIVALLLTYAFFGLLLAIGAFILVPRVIEGVAQLIRDLPNYYSTIEILIEKYPILALPGEWLSTLLPRLADMTLQIGSTVINIVIGGVISVYLLHSKEKLIAQCKKALNCLIPDPTYEKLLQIARFTHDKTRRFIIARLLDSLIVAIITYLFMLLFRIPYALLSALIIGLFNTIPYFGSILGAIPPGIIILIVKPSMLLAYLIFILLLEQLDGNIIGPKLQGKQVGLSALWVIFAIFLFGGLLGFIGTVVGVPLFAVIYYFITAAINNGLHRKGKSSETADYAAPEDRDLIE